MSMYIVYLKQVKCHSCIACTVHTTIDGTEILLETKSHHTVTVLFTTLPIAKSNRKIHKINANLLKKLLQIYDCQCTCTVYSVF